MPEKADISRTLLLPFMSIILLVADRKSVV